MRKADLIQIIAERTGVPRVDVLVTVEQFLKEIKDNLSKGENVYIRGFGSFVTKKRAKKVGRNIKEGVSVDIPEQTMPVFKPAQQFINVVQGVVSNTTDTDSDDE